MPEKAGYRVFDTGLREYLASFKKPVKGCDVAVTRWTEDPDGAMAFRVLAAARSVARWLDGKSYGGCIIINDKGDMV
jgi:hypothetical protein